MSEPQIYVACVTVLGRNGGMGRYQLARGTKEYCEEQRKQKLEQASKSLGTAAPEHNIGRIDIMPVEQWEEVRAIQNTPQNKNAPR